MSHWPRHPQTGACMLSGPHPQSIPRAPEPRSSSHTADSHRAQPGGCVYTKAGACTHYSGAFLSSRDREERRREPPTPKAKCTFVRMRTHCFGNILHGVRPQPAPFQSKGRGWWRAHSQAGLTQGRGMRGEGTAAQVALLRSWNPLGPGPGALAWAWA